MIRMFTKFMTRSIMLAALLVLGCDDGTDEVLSVDALGGLVGFVFVDRDGSGQFEPANDAPAAGVGLFLTPLASANPVATATSNNLGLYFFTDVPVGRYLVRVDARTVGDSLQVAAIDSTTVTVSARDTGTVTLALGFPVVQVDDVAQTALGKRVQLVGVALNGWATFGDSTLHVADTTGVLRVLRVAQSQVLAGDTVRVLGTVALRDGRATITEASAFRLASAALLRTPKAISTRTAATADGGLLDADYVVVSNAAILNVQPQPGGEALITVDDGSGTLEIILEPTGNFANLPELPVGAILQVRGLLVPKEGRVSWQLKPRASADLTVSFRRVTIAEARTLSVGRLVELEALALNGWQTFGDSTVHIADPTGYLRATRVRPASVFAGDSVRFLGLIAMRDGQPILTQVTPTVLVSNRPIPDPPVVTTESAADANDGILDAALVRVSNAVVTDTATLANGDFRVRVNDGSGPVDVVISRNLGLRLTAYVPNARFDITGVLVPTAGGAAWLIRPRAQTDLVERF